MFKKTLSVATLLLLFIVSSSFKPTTLHEEGGLVWLDFNKGYELSKKKNKIMLVDVYTDWCGWCKRMDRDTYAKRDVVDIINKDFIAIKFNPELNGSYIFEGKKYNGKQLEALISNYQLSGYPTTIFMYPKEKKTSVIGGYHNADNFKGILASVKKEFNIAPEKKQKK